MTNVSKAPLSYQPFLCDRLIRDGKSDTPVASLPDCIYNQAVEVSRDGILIRNAGGNILFANKALIAMFGYPLSELEGKTVLTLFPEGSHPELKKEFLEKGARKGFWQSEAVAQRKDGEQFLVSISTTCLQDEHDHPWAYISIYRDITHEREMQLQRIQSEKLAAMGEMLASVAHELNNPLTSVVGFTHLLLNKKVSADVAEHLKKISAEAVRTSKIVKRLLSFARPQKPEKVLVGVNGILQYVLGLKGHHLKIDNIRVVRHLADDEALPKVYGDYQQLLEVFLNLVNNAQQAMASSRGKGTLTVSTEPDNGSVVIRIRDTGPGIPDEIQSRLFEPFVTSKPGGTGLGLSISQKIVKEHGGQIQVESHQNRGTVFTVRLPSQPEQEISLTPSGAVSSARLPYGGKKPESYKVLVLDDEEPILDLYYHLLTRMGHRPTLTRSGPEALALIDSINPDVIISDIKIPKQTGEKFYGVLKAKDPKWVQRLVFATGDILNQETQHLIKKNKLRFLIKPFFPHQLKEVIEATVHRSDPVVLTK
ncbi:MAG TPA: ATP-binding protein [Nitrospiria bacterium]|nr:ATP-binding protein [Nitrospiria bacterium]